MRVAFPFSAIVGQDEMKRAILLTAVDPTLGGVLILGHRGTAKSTAVRALPALLPPMTVVTGCRYGCDPDAGRRRCADCLARERALSRGEKADDPGLLARAHRGYLYVD